MLLISLTESMTEREQMQTHWSANQNPTQEKYKRLCCNEPLPIQPESGMCFNCDQLKTESNVRSHIRL